MRDINKDQWKKLTANDVNAVIIDVRTSEEVAEGIIPNALHHDIYNPQELIDALNNMDKTKSYYVYCRAGGRSAQACQIMDQLGFENTYNLIGGFSEWDGDVV